jgi:hypothetical protein
MLRTGKIDYLSAPIVFLAALSRIDSIFHVGAAVFVFAVLFFWLHRSGRGMLFAGLVLGMWIAFFVARAAYFGHWMPNTQLAEKIHLGDRLRAALTLDREFYRTAIRAFLWIAKSHLAYVAVLTLPLVWLLRRDRTALAILAMAFTQSSPLWPFRSFSVARGWTSRER